MVSSFQPKSRVLHRLARFVTKEAIAHLLHLKLEQIYRIEGWRYVLYVRAQGISRFVSYADLPPILNPNPPSAFDFACWHQRLRRRKEKKVPDFWVEFYADKVQQADSQAELCEWGKLIELIQAILPNVNKLHQLLLVK